MNHGKLDVGIKVGEAVYCASLSLTLKLKLGLRLYKTLAIPTPLYGSIIWTQCRKNRPRTAEMKCLWLTAGYFS
jgi:hypothetical protein